MTPRTLARFPFLKEASAFVKGRGVDLEEILAGRAWADARERGKQRAFDSLEDLEKDAPRDVPAISESEQLREILSYPIARMIVSCTGDSFLVRRYALYEALLARARLQTEPDAFVNDVAAELEMDFTAEDGKARMHFVDFLKHTANLRGKEWKLINQAVDRGQVTLRREKALRVLQNAIQARIERQLPIEVSEEVEATFADTVTTLKQKLAERRARFRPEELGKGEIADFPPCMQKLLADIQGHENVPHMGRFAIVAFLHTIGYTNEEIFKIFGDVPDFAVDVTKYQIEHITGAGSSTEYTPPECSTMKSYSVCPGGDELCHREWMTHPLKYFRYKSKRRKRATGPPSGTDPPPDPSAVPKGPGPTP